jgi:lactoylglutathione lyase
MAPQRLNNANLKQAVPFFAVSSMNDSLRFYVDGLGFEVKMKWTPRGKIQWCWIERDGVALMLQEYIKDGSHEPPLYGPPGGGVTICFMCEDALSLYGEFLLKGLQPKEPFVGNRLWDLEIADPDGYRLHFESPTDVPEGTTYSQWKQQQV